MRRKRDKVKVSDERYNLFCLMMNEIEKAGRLMNEYDALPHEYDDEVLYQVESHVIQMIGQNPGTTATSIAQALGKTTSACSQCVKKLKKKRWIEQVRNEENNRQYNLYLTESGWDIFNKHELFDQECDERKCYALEKFSNEALTMYLEIQKRINEEFEKDVELSRENFIKISKEKLSC